jgi:hypothetical protein
MAAAPCWSTDSPNSGATHPWSCTAARRWAVGTSLRTAGTTRCCSGTDGRQGPRAHRPADLGPRRGRGSWIRPGPRATAQHQGWRPQHRRHRHRRARPDPRSVLHAPHQRGSRRQAGPRRTWMPAQGRRPGDPGAQAGHRARLYLRGRRARPDARRRSWLSDPPVRLALDNLEEAEIVTADSRIRHASREENPDLFWAIRGASA